MLYIYIPNFPADKTHRPIRRTVIFSLEILEKKIMNVIYLPSAHKTQVEFRSHFSGKKVRLMGREIQHIYIYIYIERERERLAHNMFRTKWASVVPRIQYRGAYKSLDQPTSRCILFDG